MKRYHHGLDIGLIAAFILVISASIAMPGPANGQDIREEQGVMVVRNPRTPVQVPGRPTGFSLIEELTIGRGADENSQFSELRSVQADSVGWIYALDGKDRVIKVFDPNGRFLRTIGKMGQGPGELSAPTRIILTPKDEVAVLDLGNSRLSFFKQDGALVRELSTAKWLFMRFRVSCQEEIIADHAAVSEEGGIFYQLTRFSPDLSSAVKIATEPRVIKPNAVNPFAPAFQHGVTWDGGVVWAVNSRYELTIVDPDGTTRLKILKVPEPNRITPADRQALIEEDYRNLPAGITLDIPTNYPPLWTLIVADSDHIFVRTYLKDMKGGLVHDVFDPEGRFVSQFSLGKEEFAMMARDGKLYTLVREDEDGIPLIKRYGMVWK